MSAVKIIEYKSDSESPKSHVRRFYVDPIDTESCSNPEKLLVYFPGLSGTPRSGHSSSAGTPTTSTGSPRPLPRIRSMSPTDMREDSSTDPQAMLRRKLKLPMKVDEPMAVKEKFLTFDSVDTQELHAKDVIRLSNVGRDDSFTSLDTTTADSKSSSQDSPHLHKKGSFTFRKNDADDFAWQQKKQQFYAQEELLRCDEEK